MVLLLLAIHLHAPEPTNPKEAAEKKATADKITAEKFVRGEQGKRSVQQVDNF